MNDLLLLSGQDIPFPSAQIVIHPPTIKEIALIGEESFFLGAQFLHLSKDQILSPEEAQQHKDLSDFDLLILLLNNPPSPIQRQLRCVQDIFIMLFPTYKTTITPMGICLFKDGQNFFINRENFEQFKELTSPILGLSIFKDTEAIEYDPGSKLAQRLAAKFDAYHKKLKQLKKQDNKGQKITILSRYISILAVGEQKSINSLMEYTLFQLLDEFDRFMLKQESDIYIQASMAGAQNLEEVENWMKELHEE